MHFYQGIYIILYHFTSCLYYTYTHFHLHICYKEYYGLSIYYLQLYLVGSCSLCTFILYLSLYFCNKLTSCNNSISFTPPCLCIIWPCFSMLVPTYKLRPKFVSYSRRPSQLLLWQAPTVTDKFWAQFIYCYKHGKAGLYNT